MDFLLYIGANSTDEPVFEQLRAELGKEDSRFFSANCEHFLTVLGKRPSKADFYVDE